MKKYLLVFLLPAILAGKVMAFHSHPLTKNKYAGKFSVEQVATGIDVPWGMVQLAGGELLVTERSGALYRVATNGQLTTISGLPEIAANGQGGLLDIALHPNFARNSWVYLTLSSPQGGTGSHTALIRAKFDQQNNRLTQVEMLYKGKENSRNGRHYGSRIAFDEQGFVYFSIGDRGDRDTNPQDLSRDGGKIYRLHDDGRIPLSNPFKNEQGEPSAIYSYGHRNPQGLVFDKNSKQLWAHEHGPKGGDELNLINAGDNYGWPLVSYGVNYSGTLFTKLTEKPGMTSPELYWKPSIAPSGLIIVNSEQYPSLNGHLLLGSLKFGYIVLVERENEQVIGQHIVLSELTRVRSLLQGQDGYIYLGIDGQGIKRLKNNN